MLPTYKKNARITIKTGGSFSATALDDWESTPEKSGQFPALVMDAYLKRIQPAAKTNPNNQRGTDETLDQYLGFIWPPDQLPADFGNRQICEVEFTDGSERKGEAEVTRRVMAAKDLLQSMNDNGDRIEVRFAAQLRGVA
jgi:hypothetical protein